MKKVSSGDFLIALTEVEVQRLRESIESFTRNRPPGYLPKTFQEFYDILKEEIPNV